MLSIVIFFGKVKKRMAAVLFKDFHQKLVEEIKSLIPTEKKNCSDFLLHYARKFCSFYFF